LTHFFIEFRLQGYAKRYAKWASANIGREAKKIGIKKLRQPRFVSHITLFGPARTNNLRQVLGEVERIGRKYTLVPFKIGGFDKFQNPDANWLYLSVSPSTDLEQFRYELAQSLCSLERTISDTCESYDHKSKFKFHTSIGKYDTKDKDKFKELCDYAETRCSLESYRQHRASIFGRLINIVKKYIFIAEEDDPRINLHLIRVTILGKRNRIQREYDLVLKKLLTRREALSRYWWRRTIEKLKMELAPPREDRLSLHDASKCYLIADTHFDHKNTIIKFIHRPFSNVNDMNEVIKNNWNKSVDENDIVYFLGDYTLPPRGRSLKIYFSRLRWWTGQLTGNKISILGNHDRNGGGIEFEKARILHIGQHSFLLIHDPEDKKIKTIKASYDWVIHGHVHNNKMDKYPFINGENKTINVSVELTDYKPVSLSYLLSLNLDSIKRMRTINSQPERW